MHATSNLVRCPFGVERRYHLFSAFAMGFTGIHDTPSIQSYVTHVVPGPTNSVVAVAAKTSIIASQVSKYSKKYIHCQPHGMATQRD